MKSPLLFEKQFQVQTFEIDQQKRIRPAALTQLMQEASMQHVIKMGLSVWDLEAHQVSWVLMRQKLWFERLPMLGEKIRIATSPSGFNRSFTYRDFIVYDESDQRVAAASTTWLLMETQVRKMAPIPAFIKEFESKMPAEEDCLPKPAGKVPLPQKIDRSTSFQVNWHDLDFNGHLSNTRFLQWMLEALPPNRLDQSFPTSIQIEYKNECLYPEKLIAEVEQVGPNSFSHCLKKVESKQVVSSAISEWSEFDL